MKAAGGGVCAKSDPRALARSARSALIDNQGPCDCSPTYLSCLRRVLFFFLFLSALRLYAVSSEYATDLQQATTAVGMSGPTISPPGNQKYHGQNHFMKEVKAQFRSVWRKETQLI